MKTYWKGLTLQHTHDKVVKQMYLYLYAGVILSGLLFLSLVLYSVVSIYLTYHEIEISLIGIGIGVAFLTGLFIAAFRRIQKDMKR